MAIKAYVGSMGAGKTYEVCRVVILDALRNGRRVVSNIAGLNYEAFVALLVEEGVPRDKIGQLICISHEKPLEPEFWRTDEDSKLGIEAFIQPGDLLALDEVWRFWEGFSAKGMSPRVKNFFRMHRQFVNPVSGLTCEIAFICQDILDLARSVRSVIEETYVMEKLTVIGATHRYRVDVCRKTYVNRKPLRQLQRTYEEKYFSLYKSHSQAKEDGAGPREQNIDNRGNVLRGALFKIVLPLAVPAFIGAVWVLWGFFHPKAPESKEASTSAAASTTAQAPVKGNKSQVADGAPPPVDAWRVVGWYQGVGDARVILSDGRNTRFIVSPQGLKVTALSTEVALPEGGFASSWSGGSSGRSSLVGGQPE